MARLEGVDPEQVTGSIKTVFDSQTRQWGAPLLPYVLYARQPALFRAVTGMWAGLHTAGLLNPGLVALVNRRVAAINGCEF